MSGRAAVDPVVHSEMETTSRSIVVCFFFAKLKDSVHAPPPFSFCVGGGWWSWVSGRGGILMQFLIICFEDHGIVYNFMEFPFLFVFENHGNLLSFIQFFFCFEEAWKFMAFHGLPFILC